MLRDGLYLRACAVFARPFVPSAGSDAECHCEVWS